MKRFWKTLDRDLFGLSAALLFLSAYVALTGEYPSKYRLTPARSGSGIEAAAIAALAGGIAGVGFMVRGAKKKANDEKA